MGLIQCPECNKQISDKAVNCPQCGAPRASFGLVSRTLPGHSKGRTLIHIFLLLLLAIIAGVSYWFLRVSTNNKVAPLSAGFSAAFRQPKKAVEERLDLKEGQFVSFSFVLRTNSRVQVQVIAETSQVDVTLMTKQDADKFRQTSGRLSAQSPALLSKQVLMMDRTEVLQKGEWTIIVSRPLKVLSSQGGTSVKIAVTVY